MSLTPTRDDPNKFLVVADLRRPGSAADVHVLDAPGFLACLPV